MIKLLNLYSGLGGSVALLDRTKFKITSVENNLSIALIYKQLFPIDTVVNKDAIKYLEDNHEKFDIIIVTSPCQSHSAARERRDQNRPVVSDHKSLFGVIQFLQDYYKGDWYAENVASMKRKNKDILSVPRFNPVKIGKHYIWSNKTITAFKATNSNVRHSKIQEFIDDLHSKGLKITRELISTASIRKDTLLRNTMNPETGLKIMEELVK